MTEINMNAATSDPSDRANNFLRITQELGRRKHSVQLDFPVPKHLGISMRMDCLVDAYLVILKKAKFQYQIRQLQQAGYTIFLVPHGKMSADDVQSFCDMVETKDGSRGRTT
ncbi:MAG: hypothetical protein ABR985_00590 [Methanotrichaceae archaeon]|jgi:fructose-1,6-bisphosphatase/sedoheptulose 1,7-bisphosphatase-like protein